MRDHILNLWKRWDDAEAKAIAAVNFFLDAPSAQRQAEIRALRTEVGECTDAGPVMPENWMRGQFNITCAERHGGRVLHAGPNAAACRAAPIVSEAGVVGVRMGAPTGAPAGRVLHPVACIHRRTSRP